MKEARSAILIILVLLFILVGVGVAISRISETKETQDVVKTEEDKGILDRIFFRGDDEEESETADASAPGQATSDADDTMVIVNETSSDDTEDLTFSYNDGVAGVSTSSVQGVTSKGGVMAETPSSIPATGTPGVVLVTSLAGLAGGLYLRKKD